MAGVAHGLAEPSDSIPLWSGMSKGFHDSRLGQLAFAGKKRERFTAALVIAVWVTAA